MRVGAARPLELLASWWRTCELPADSAATTACFRLCLQVSLPAVPAGMPAHHSTCGSAASLRSSACGAAAPGGGTETAALPRCRRARCGGACGQGHACGEAQPDVASLAGSGGPEEGGHYDRDEHQGSKQIRCVARAACFSCCMAASWVAVCSPTRLPGCTSEPSSCL